MIFNRYKTQEARRKTQDTKSLLPRICKPLSETTLFLFCFIFLLFSSSQGQQTYPVRSTISVRYPSVYLDEYADITNTSATITLLDLQKTDYRVLVKLSMESADLKLYSKEPIPLVISGGVPVDLDFSDPNIARLFAYDNLIPEKGKITEFQNSKSLPEGLYLVKLEVYDANFPNINVSNVNTNIATILVQRFDPPLLNMPQNNSSILQDPFSMNLFFGWTPRSITANPNIRIMYYIKMVEVPDGRNPYDAINVAGNVYPIAMLADSGLTFPTFTFTPEQLAMTQGRTYAWQVTAYEEDPITGSKRYQRFRNQGKSEVFTFTVQENCPQIDAASIRTETTGEMVNISWDKIVGHTEYELNYREMGSIYQYTPVSVKVVDDNTNVQTIPIDISSLEKGIQYEFKIAAKCTSWQPEVYGGLFKVQKQDCSAPTPINIESTPTEVKLTWAPTDNTQKYRLRYKGGNNALENEVIVDVASTSTTLPALQVGKTYQIIVDAVCNSGGLDLGRPYTLHPNENGYAGGCPIPQPFKLIVDHTPGTMPTAFKWSHTEGLHKAFRFYVVRKDLYDLAPSTVAWAQAPVAIPQVNIDTLTEDRLYAYKIDYICDNNQVSTTAVGFFKLEKEPTVAVNPGTGNCFPPATSAAEGIDVDAASFEWSKSDNAEEYQLFYAPKGSNDFKVFNTTQKNTTLEDLDVSKTHIYKYKLRARCANAKYSLFTDTALVDLDTRYKGDCIYTGTFRSDNQAAHEIRLVWKHMDNTAYVVSYREESQKVSPMYTSQINADTVNKYKDGDSLRFTIKNLAPKTNYVFYLQPVCGTEQGKKLGPLNVATKESAINGACGEGKVLCDSKSQVPLASDQLIPIQKQGTGTGAYYKYDDAPDNSIFKAADIEIITTDAVSYNSTTKTYSGTGVAKMELDLGDAGKMLNGGGSSDVDLSDRIKTSVKFTNITINDARCLIKGTVEVTGIELNVLSDEQKAKVNQFVEKYNQVLQQLIDAGKQLSEALELAKTYTEQAENYLDGGQKYGNVKTGSIVPVPENADYSVSGNTVKDKSGNTIATIASPAPTLTAKDTTLCQKTGAKYVTFSNAPGAAYDFDEYKEEYFTHRKVAREYKALRYEGGKYYYVSAKALVEGKVDKVKANLNGYTAADLTFKSSAGVTYNFNTSDQTLSIPGGTAGDGQHIFVYSKSKGDSVVGRLLVANYPTITKNVVFVTVGDPTKWKNKPNFTVADVKAKVETLFADSYNKIGIKYNIELDELTLKTDDSWDAEPKDGMVQDSRSGFLDNNFTGEEKALVSLYQSYFENIDSTKSYLFFTPDGKLATGDLQGKMPRGKRTGFIFMQGSSLTTVSKTVLHELGHGPHSLAHIFNSDWLDTDASKSNGLNLTAYGDGTDLIKYQWDIMHDPGVVLGFFEKDKDAEKSKKPSASSLTVKVCDNVVTKDNYYDKTSDCKLLANCTLPASSTIKKLNVKVSIKLCCRTSEISKSFVVEPNKDVELKMDSLPEGKYTISFTDLSNDAIAFYIKQPITLNVCGKEVKFDDIAYQTNGKAIKIKYTTDATNTGTTSVIINYSGEDKTKYNKTFQLSANTETDITPSPLVNGKYSITLKSNDNKILSRHCFYIRDKQYDFPCKVCGRDLTLTLAKIKQMSLTSKDPFSEANVKIMNDALKKAGFNSCKSHVHFFSQSGCETYGFTKFVEDVSFSMTGFYNGATFVKNCNTKVLYNQSIWDDKTYKDYFSFKQYEVSTNNSAASKYLGATIKKYKWAASKDSKSGTESCKTVNVEAGDTIKFPTTYNSTKTVSTGTTFYVLNSLTSTQKENCGKKLYSTLYSYMLGNGDIASEDGYNFRGRGFVHLTGKENYKKVSDKCNSFFGTNFDFVTNYEKVTTDHEQVIYSAVGYYMVRNAIQELHSCNCYRATYIVNGGYNGYDDKTHSKYTRLSLFKKFKTDLFYDCNVNEDE